MARLSCPICNRGMLEHKAAVYSNGRLVLECETVLRAENKAIEGGLDKFLVRVVLRCARCSYEIEKSERMVTPDG